VTLEEAYKKWKHLDKILFDKEFCISNPVWCWAYDLWQVLKKEMAEEKNQAVC